jgi:putative aldouronate transport system substrate-binding protein
MSITPQTGNQKTQGGKGKMRKSAKKTLAVLIALLFVLTAMTACTTTSQPPTTAPTTGVSAAPAIDISKKVELKLFMISDAPLNQADTDQFESVLNGMLTKDLNCTIKIDFAAGNDYQNNNSLALASGENYDLIYSADWLLYSQYAKKGAFKDLTALIPVYAPNIWKTMSANRWDGVKIDGKIMGIPSQAVSYSESCFMYREDLRVKYNLPEIKDLDTVEAYLKGIKDNVPDMVPSDDYQAQVFNCMWLPSTKYQVVDVAGDNQSNFVIDPANPRVLLETIETPEFKAMLPRMKKWADMGFWSQSALSSLEWGEFPLLNGKAAATFNGQFPNDTNQVPQLEKDHPGWKIGFFEWNRLNPKSVVTGQGPTSNMLSVTFKAPNPERALMVVDKCQTDPTYYMLTQYGIEGVNYTMTADKQISFGTIDLSKHSPFAFWPAGATANDALMPKKADAWPTYYERIAQDVALTKPSILAGFVLDTQPIQTQYTAINDVKTQYGNPLMIGLVPDVDAAYATFLQQSKAAGLDACRDEIQKQLNAFLDSRGVK